MTAPYLLECGACSMGHSPALTSAMEDITWKQLIGARVFSSCCRSLKPICIVNFVKFLRFDVFIRHPPVPLYLFTKIWSACKVCSLLQALRVPILLYHNDCSRSLIQEIQTWDISLTFQDNF
jgi:hypothetical protein